MTNADWPKQASGNRFEYRKLEHGWQVYGETLLHVCYCDSEEIAQMVTKALNKEGG